MLIKALTGLFFSGVSLNVAKVGTARTVTADVPALMVLTVTMLQANVTVLQGGRYSGFMLLLLSD